LTATKNRPNPPGGVPPRMPAGEEKKVIGFLAALCLFYGLLTALPLLASLFSFAVSRPLVFLFILLSLAGAGMYWKSLRGNRIRRPLRRPGRLAAGFFGLTLLLYLALWILAYSLPDFSYDGNYYHTPPIHFWLRGGGIHWIGTGISPHWQDVSVQNWNGYPKGVEVVQYVFLLASGSVRLLNTGNLLFLPLGVAAIIAISLILGARPGFALAAGCLFVLMPINLAQSLTAMVDTASASAYLAFFALLLGVIQGFGRGKVPWKLAVGAGAALGLAVGSKGPGLFLVPAGGAVLLFRLLQSRRRSRRKIGEGSEVRPGLGSGLLLIAAVLLVGISLGGFWAGRNWMKTGNPLYPVEIRVAGRPVFPGVDFARQFRPPYRAGTEDWSQPGRIISNWFGCFRFGDPGVLVYDSRSGGLGFPWLLSIPAVIGLIVILRKRKTRGVSESGAGYLMDLIFLCLVMFFAMPRDHNHMSRYTIWLAGLGLPCLAVVCGRLAAKSGKKLPLRYAGFAWFGLACLLAGREALAGLRLHFSFTDTFRGREAAAFSFGRLVRAARSPYPAGYYWGDLNGTIFEMIMAGTEPVGVALGERSTHHLVFGHLVQGSALGSRRIVFIDHLRAESEPDYLPRLIEENALRYVIWDSALPLNAALVNDSIRQDYRLANDLLHVFTFEVSP